MFDILSREPAIGTTSGNLYWEGRSHIFIEEVMLPLAHDGTTVSQIMAAARRT